MGLSYPPKPTMNLLKDAQRFTYQVLATAHDDAETCRIIDQWSRDLPPEYLVRVLRNTVLFMAIQYNWVQQIAEASAGIDVRAKLIRRRDQVDFEAMGVS